MKWLNNLEQKLIKIECKWGFHIWNKRKYILRKCVHCKRFWLNT